MKVTIQECIEKYNTEHLAAVIAAGTVPGTGGRAYDYYRDREGTYWYDSRAASEPVAVRFMYGGGPAHREAVQKARAARGRYPWLQAWQGKRA